ncbi:hypothetical protein EXIGLDRAFT_835757 [Exidia glandulosa HHB12029]|uniref:Uncharacterized protein n=1 Tax=Exidia glandulosa HHB12029 TaxID=1314781 RepID=A0A165IFQ4_EXIGL|nr:hypothetical protein EXIGLDRAFT_835757 [Exidia glandulosa HHB12029]
MSSTHSLPVLPEGASHSTSMTSSALGDRSAEQSTRLDHCLADLPWVQGGHRVGYGLNAVTGMITTTPAVRLVGASTLPKTVPSTRRKACVISSTDDLKRELEISAGASLNILPLDCSTGAYASIKTLASMSETSLSLLVLDCTVWEDDDTDVVYELTADAEELARKSPTTFRKRYGDYFIAGARWGSELIAVATCTFTNSSKKRHVSNILQTAARRLDAIGFDINVAHHTDTELSSLNVNVCIDIRSRGMGLGAGSRMSENLQRNLNKTVQSFVDLVPMLESTVAPNAVEPQGDRIYALLRHYSVAHSMHAIPTTLPIALEVFDEIEVLRDTVLECNIRSNALPSFISDRVVPALKRRVMSLQRQMHRAQDIVAINATRRAELLVLATTLRDDLERFHEVHDLFNRLLLEAGKEPGSKRHSERDSYGCGWNTVNSRIPNFVIEEGEKIDVSIRAWWPTNNVKAIIKKPDNCHIVGWNVVAHEPQLGSWRQLSASVILATEGMITFRREHAWRTWFRSCRWTFRIFVVRDNKLLDLFFQQSDHENKSSMMTLQTAPTRTPM